MNQVVVIEEEDVVSRGLLQTVVPCGGGAPVRGQAVEADSGREAGELYELTPFAFSGPIVDDDNLAVRMRLGQDALYGRWV